MIIRQLTSNDSAMLESLIYAIESGMENRLWWLPINRVSRNHFLDPEWCYFLGVFDNGKLVAASCLFLNEHEFKESLKSLDDVPLPVAEIGRCMVMPAYRGNNLLLTVNKELLSVAKAIGIKTIIVTIHPDNIASKRSFLKLGAELKATTVKNSFYDRDIYTINV